MSCALRKKPIVNISLVEAEFVIATSVTCQAVWMHMMLTGLSQNYKEPTTIYRDNNSPIALLKSHVFHREPNILTQGIISSDNW